MTRNHHDSFIKEWMQEVLADFGQIETERQSASEVLKIDLYFYPDPEKLKDLQNLGLLGQMLNQPAILEPFRNPVSQWEIENCRNKVFQVKTELRRDARRKKLRPSPKNIPFAWILSPTVSETQRKAFLTQERNVWGSGIYFLAEPDRTAIVAIHELPKTPETLLLRLVGRGQVQGEAIKELVHLPDNSPYKTELLHHISRLQINLKLRQNKTKDIREVIMNLSPAYDQWLETTLSQGREEGRKEGRKEGHKEGHKEGRGEAKVEIATQMLKNNLSLTDIVKYTGLSIETLQSLQLKQTH